MWMGVTRGLAGRKFSGSPKRLGQKRAMEVKETRRSKNPIKSLAE